MFVNFDFPLLFRQIASTEGHVRDSLSQRTGVLAITDAFSGAVLSIRDSRGAEIERRQRLLQRAGALQGTLEKCVMIRFTGIRNMNFR